MTTVIVVGNPKPNSRTRAAAENLVAKLGLGEPGTDEAPDVIELSELGAGLLGWGDPAVTDAVSRVQRAEVVVFASPTFKATYSGLLKLFLDQFAGGTGIQGVVAIPLMLGAAPNHALASDLTLKPVLVEIGGICPTPGLYQLDSTFADDPALDAWTARWGVVIDSILGRTTAP